MSDKRRRRLARARGAAFGLPIQRWRTRGTHILICPNSSTYFGLFRLDAERWVATVIDQIRRVSDRPIVVRWKTTDRPLAEDLVNCWATVTYASAAAIMGLIAGVPCFNLAEHASARRMGLDDLSRIEHPWFPDDREGFCAVLAANQWTLAEMRAGHAWRALSGTGAPKTPTPDRMSSERSA